MDNSVKLIVHRGSTIFDCVVVTIHSVIRHEQKVRNDSECQRHVSESKAGAQVRKISINKKRFNAYFVSAYVGTLANSKTYRKSAFERLLQYISCKLSERTTTTATTNVGVIFMKLRTPQRQFLDYKWNEKMAQMAVERREVDHAMSWLSTLGGAFSALGEEFQYCAEMAGRISVKQFELALRLGDPLLVARCKLYAALSLIQQGHLEIPKKVVRSTYRFSIDQNDVRLRNMCHGIWAKLTYCHKMRKERRKRPV
ncbi:uncharacterized protein LOC108631464 [Ceratina calcarata]|uniref:Uncharacterized protein LOC108631464 n=1 Tax=Ceratina calcarata TaxID=156304 RepID=A0AAJ7NE85_9HYME|nr:uncharacterized protein LOC108631464 [Ceratina calcarata]